MSSDKKSKSYGLIMPKKVSEASKSSSNVSTTLVKKPSVFDDESSDEDAPTDWRKQIGQSKVKKQTKLEMSRALEEDPTVYQYDEVYDAMEADKAEKSASAALQKKNQVRSRFIIGQRSTMRQKNWIFMYVMKVRSSSFFMTSLSNSQKMSKDWSFYCHRK